MTRPHGREAQAAWRQHGALSAEALARALRRSAVRDMFYALTDRFPAARSGGRAAIDEFLRVLDRLADTVAEIEPALAAVFGRERLRLLLARLAARQHAREREPTFEAEVRRWLALTEARPPTPELGARMHALMGKRRPRGRPSGPQAVPGEMTPDRLEREVRLNARKLIREGWRPTQRKVAENMQIGERTLRRVADLFGMDIRRVLREERAKATR